MECIFTIELRAALIFRKPLYMLHILKTLEKRSDFLDVSHYGVGFRPAALDHDLRVIIPFCKGRRSRNITQPWPNAA